jgi:uncharacterized protein (DUF305 family)
MKMRVVATHTVLLAGVLALASCAGSPESGMVSSAQDGSASGSPVPGLSDVNNFDIMFATTMIPQHNQALEISTILLSKDGIDPRVTALAKQIEAARVPEMEQMDGWLQDWGAGPLDLDGAEHGDGMMTPDDMQALEVATGAEASRLFLELMIQHHRDAIEMAQDEAVHGRDSDAVALAHTIIDAQTAEITTMEGILAVL